VVVAIALALTIRTAGSPAVLAGVWDGASLPFARVHGLSKVGSDWLVGGLRGLSLGHAGAWEQSSGQSVRQITEAFGGDWVLYGSGSVDKIDPKSKQLYYDVFHEAVKRPWVASMAASNGVLLCGTQGGWIERTPKGITERYPKELGAKPVEAIARGAGATWLGTQDGLFRVSGSQVKRFGLASGLADLWITGLLPSGKDMIAGLADGGLARVSGNLATPIPSPSKKVRFLLRWNGYLVVGALDGTWIRRGDEWFRLTDGECTFLGSVDGKLAVGEPTDVRFFGVPERAAQR